MADFHHLDDEAVLVMDDSPLAAGALVQLRRNAQAASDARFAQGGWNSVQLRSSALRACSVFPAAWGPWVVRFDPFKSVQTAQVTIHVVPSWTVNFANTGPANPPPNGSPAVHLAITCGDLYNRERLPPLRASDEHWTVPAKGGVLLPFNSPEVETAVTLTANVGGLNAAQNPQDALAGWVAFYLWTWSRLPVDADGAPISNYAEFHIPQGSADLSSGMVRLEPIGGGNFPTPNPYHCERAVGYHALVQGSKGDYTETPIFDAHQAVYMRELQNNRYVVGTVPPIMRAPSPDAENASYAAVSMYDMGVAQIHSIAIQADSEEIAPPESAFHIDRPALGAHVSQLANSLLRIQTQRLPTFMTYPPKDYDYPFTGAAGSQRPTNWRLLSHIKRSSIDGPWSDPVSRNSQSPSVLYSVFLSHEELQNFGQLHAVVRVAAFRSSFRDQYGDGPTFKHRLQLYNADTGASIAVTGYRDMTLPVNSGYSENQWSPTGQLAFLSVAYDDEVDWRGGMPHPAYNMNSPTGQVVERRPNDWLLAHWFGLKFSIGLLSSLPPRMTLEYQIYLDASSEGYTTGFEQSLDVITMAGGVAVAR